MKKNLSKLLAVMLSILMIAASMSVAFAADGGLSGSGTEAAPYLIASADDLAELSANLSAYNGKYIALAGDIDISALCDGSYAPIGTEAAPFTGTFDGKGYAIEGDADNYLTDDAGLDYSGLFGYAKNAVIQNVTIKKVSFNCAYYVGIAVGYAKDTQILNVITNSCTIEASGNAGGIAGYIKNSTAADCRNDCAVTLYDEDNVGGIVGAAVDSEILRCVNAGAVEGVNLNCGGIVGSVTGTVSHCINKGSVISTRADAISPEEKSAGVGGIAGRAEGEISCCGNIGNVECGQDCGGVFGYGDAVTVSCCYNVGSLSSYWKEDTIGFTGEGTITNCVGVGNGVTVADMKASATYDGWDFDTVWYAPVDDIHNYPYPTLRDCNFHTFTQQPPIEPTCTATGAINYTCVCGLEGAHEVIPALGHIWEEDPDGYKAPTCIADGYKTFRCTREGCTAEPQVETIEKTPDQHTDVAPEDNICDVCGVTIKEEEVKKNIFQKIADFFRRIIEWIRNLFKR